MKIFRYRDYDSYRAAQILANRKKLSKVWCVREEVSLICEYIDQHMAPPTLGLCHGVRNAREVLWFREILRAEILGTDISPTATEFPHVLQWDFHDVKPEWLGAVDFVFSNSLDHSYDPRLCLRQWMSCVRPGGLCFIAWTEDNIKATPTDPFGATLGEYCQLASDDYSLRDVLALSASEIKVDPISPERLGLNVCVDRYILVLGHRP